MSAKHEKPGNLPGEVVETVGRGRELTQVREILAQTRLLTLTGAGGIGKSRLALGAARRIARLFENGVWLVDLSEVGDPRLAASAVARTLALPEKRGDSFEESIARFLRKGPALLLLDNCEHLLDTTAELALGLLEACPELRILATSREPLGLEGETTFSVPTLEVPAPGAVVKTPAEALAFGAVQLFAERAAAADPGFEITPQNVATVVEICQLLDGIPLGLELAAVRVRTISLDDLRRRLDDQLSLGRLNRRLAAHRHQTLAATFEWSRGSLNEQECLLWDRLSVFSGGFTLAAAEQVCSDAVLPVGAVLETLTGLVEKSLLVVEQGRAQLRYRLLEPVRQFGLDRLRSAGSERELRSRHLGWCLEWTAVPGSWWAVLDAREIDEMVETHPNLLSALDFSLDDPGEVHHGLELLEQVARIWWRRDRLREFIHYADAFLARVTTPSRTRARVLFETGLCEVILGNDTRARELFEECRHFAARRRSCRFESGLADYGAGLADVWTGNTSGATAHMSRAITLFDEPLATAMHASALLWLAIAAINESRYEDGRALVARSLKLNEDARDRWNEGIALCLRGKIHLHDGNREAESDFREALRLEHAIRHRVGIAYNLQALALSAAAGDQHVRAVRLLGASEAIAEELGVALSQGWRATATEAADEGQTALGIDRFTELFAAGKRMPAEEAVTFALDEPAVARERSQASGKSTLTRREAEVARLIAAGATNRRIATTLVISDQTVKFHVHNILVKLGFESRSEIAAWEARQRLI